MKDENITITELCKKIALSDPGARKNIENNKQDYLKQGYIVINQVMKQGQSIDQIRVTSKGIDYFMSKYPYIKLSQTDIRKLETKQDETKSDKEAVKNSQYVELLEKTITDLKEENKRLNDKIDQYQEQQTKDREALTNQFNQLFETNRKLADNMQGLMDFMKNQPKQLTGDVIQEQPPTKKQNFFSKLFKRGQTEE